MKSVKPALYVLIAVVFAALLYVVYAYKNIIDPFENKDIMSHLQNMSSDQKDIVCKSLNEQIASYTDQMKNATPEQREEMMKDLAPLQKTSSSYGC
jgi:hypothetical protein